MTAPTTKILFLVFNGGMDTLDFTGPLETLMQANTSPSGKGHKYFEATVAATNEITVSSQSLRIKRDISIKDAIERIGEFDIFIVPGGRGTRTMVKSEYEGEEALLIKAFATHHAGHDRERVMMSVCTGAHLLAAGGWLKDLKATTHHSAFDLLRELCDMHGSTELTMARFVDAGARDGLRVITAGGVSSGLDASIYLLGLRCGSEVAGEVAEILEYASRQDEGVVVQ